MMSRSPRFTSALVALLLSACTVVAQQPATKKKQPSAATPASTVESTAKVAPAGLLPVVVGEGTPGTITKWTGSGIVNTIGNSVMIEDGAGRIGIGTATPASKLTVQGMIETTMGGYKFPDGTIQTTAAVGGLLSVSHNATLTGNGTSASPLGIAPAAVGTIHLANQAVTAAKIANGAVVRSLNGLLDNVQLAAGSNITITPSGSALTIAAPNLLSSVAHNSTLTGSGTSSSSLGVAIPLDLTASVPWFVSNQLLNVVNEGESGDGVRIVAGNSSNNGSAGQALVAWGGQATSGPGGGGVFGIGGLSNSGAGGTGVGAQGGSSASHFGGVGVKAGGGDSDSTFGGDGIQTMGGDGSGAGKNGGHRILARGGVGKDGAVNGLAGNFQGNVLVTGSLSKGGGSFKIDHPLDPENKYLSHSFVESPDMKNIYDGVVKLDANGEAVVELPEWFQALNRDYRYLLTAIGAPAPALFIAEEVSNNRFKIAGGNPGMKVSWQVTGIRQDAFANKHRIQIEEVKTEQERGFYLHPEAFNQPEERSVEWARHPQMMRRMKEAREQIKQKAQADNQ